MQKACVWSRMLAGEMLGWAEKQVSKAATFFLGWPRAPTCIDLQHSALCNRSLQLLNLPLTAGAKQISHLKDN